MFDSFTSQEPRLDDAHKRSFEAFIKACRKTVLTHSQRDLVKKILQERDDNPKYFLEYAERSRKLRKFFPYYYIWRTAQEQADNASAECAKLRQRLKMVKSKCDELSHTVNDKTDIINDLQGRIWAYNKMDIDLRSRAVTEAKKMLADMNDKVVFDSADALLRQIINDYNLTEEYERRLAEQKQTIAKKQTQIDSSPSFDR